MDISTEMLTTEHRSMNLLSTLRYIQNFVPDKLGEVYVKYLEPINIHDFLIEQGFQDLNLQNVSRAAENLTKNLQV